MTQELLKALQASATQCLQAAVDCLKADPKNPVEVNMWLENAKLFRDCDHHLWKHLEEVPIGKK